MTIQYEKLTSVANIMIVTMSCAVRNISRNKPRTMDSPSARALPKKTGVAGKRPRTRPAAAMEPMISAKKITIDCVTGTAPMRANARVTYDQEVTFSCNWNFQPISNGRTYCRIEQSPADTKEDPDVDHEAEAEDQGNVEQLYHLRSRVCGKTAGACMRDLRSGE